MCPCFCKNLSIVIIQECPYFLNFPPICPYFLGLGLAGYALVFLILFAVFFFAREIEKE